MREIFAMQKAMEDFEADTLLKHGKRPYTAYRNFIIRTDGRCIEAIAYQTNADTTLCEHHYAWDLEGSLLFYLTKNVEKSRI